MKQTLTDFLKQAGEQERQQAPERRARREEWLASLKRLLGQIKGWVREADTAGVLAVTETEEPYGEPSLGPYKAPALKIRLGERVVGVRSSGWWSRLRLGPNGDSGPPVRGLVRMAIERQPNDPYDMLFPPKERVLLRGVEGGEEHWLVGTRDLSDLRPLDQESFQAELLKLLRWAPGVDDD